MSLASVMGGSGTSSSTREILRAIDFDRTATTNFLSIARPTDAESQLMVRRAQILLALHLSKNRQFEESKEIVRSVIEAEQLQKSPLLPIIYTFLNVRGLTYERQGDHQHALADYQASLPLAQSLFDADPHDLDAKLNLEIAHGHIAVEKRLSHQHLRSSESPGGRRRNLHPRADAPGRPSPDLLP